MKTLSLSLLLAALPAMAQDYFPLQIGNQWIYQVGFFGRMQTITVDIPRAEIVNGQVYSVVRGFPEGEAWLRSNDAGILYRYNPNATGGEEVWAMFNTPEGGSYRTTITPCNQTAKVESRNAKASLPAADFVDLLAIKYPVGICADAGFDSELYAPYIGLVQRTSITFAGPRVMKLMYARLGGVTVLSQPETSFSLSLDSSVYETAAPVLTARITIRNTTPRPLQLRFSSSQRYNLLIRNSQGDEVFNLAATQLFAQELGEENISNGEKNWVVIMPLILRPGMYSAEAYLTTTDAKPRYAATASFEVVAPQ